MENKVLLAVNGTLMRGLELENNLKEVGASFRKKSQTEKAYRLYSINDKYPAMIKDENGESIAVEVYEISEEGMKEVLAKEPKGLTIEKINLIDGQEVYGVVGEPFIVEGQKDITEYKGWRKYINKQTRLKRFTPLICRAIVVVSLIILLLILMLIKSNPDSAEWMMRTLVRAYGAFASGLSSIFPFISLTELLFVGMACFTIFLLVRFIIHLVKRRPIKGFCRLLDIAIMVAITVNAYHFSCEAGYNRKPIPLPYCEIVPDRTEYVEIYNYFANDMNECIASLEFQASGDVKANMSLGEMTKEVKKAYSIIDGNSYYHPHFGSVKPMMSSFIYREFQITGVTFSPFSEANIDVMIPVTDIPFTIAHELAHTKGVMREDEANQLAFYVCLNSEHPLLRFSAYNRYFGLMTSMASTAYLTDEERENLIPLNSQYWKYVSFENKFWKEHDLLKKIGDFFNNLYIKSSGVKEGTNSYSGGTEYTYDPTEHRITVSKYHKLFFEKYYRE